MMAAEVTLFCSAKVSGLMAMARSSTHGLRAGEAERSCHGGEDGSTGVTGVLLTMTTLAMARYQMVRTLAS